MAEQQHAHDAEVVEPADEPERLDPEVAASRAHRAASFSVDVDPQ